MPNTMGRSEIREDEANRSDSGDDDYNDRNPASSHKRKTVRAPSSKKPKRPRYKYNSDDGDDAHTSDEDDLLSEASFSADSAEVERTATGRPRRAVTKNTTNLAEESDDDEESDTRQQPSDDDQQQKRSLIVKLQAYRDPDTGMAVTRSKGRVSRATSASAPPTRRIGVRRSSRQSNDGDFVELTTSGRHAKSVVGKSATPEPSTSRPIRSGKRMPGHGPIIEASQEDSQADSELHDQDTAAQKDEDADDPLHELLVGDVNSEGAIIAESQHSNPARVDEEEAPKGPTDADQESADDDEDDVPIRNHRLSKRKASATTAPELEPEGRPSSRRQKSRRAVDESSDFNPAEAEGQDEDEEDGMSGSSSPRKPSQASSAVGRRSGLRKRKRGGQSGASSGDDSVEIDQDELADEARELSRKRTRLQDRAITYESRETRRRTRGPQPDYRIFKPEALPPSDDEGGPQPTSSYRNKRYGGGPYRNLLSTVGPFGGVGGSIPIFGGPETAGAVGGADSDSSDDEGPSRFPRVGGSVGMTPTTAIPPPFLPQSVNADPAQPGAAGGGPSGLGKVKDKKALADADPLGVDQNVNFDGVGGLDNHINQLKEMVALPLLYPEVFQQFKITPPRGVLFHGPPGTGKTLLARALAASVSAQGRKVTFYMRKGADALSKWVGEAERQLRLLFEEARKNQPSIIFFDEIDGLAPVRSSKQEQIHASIVATLLALMDGMDGRGQVIVIGATNRPDSVDPALRRPGRFDREFYFPLPDKGGRRAIIDIHTRGWEPPLQQNFKDQLAALTKGYGGADLRALCTEAALNAVQGTYPQIYKSNEKLIIDPTTIRIQPKDFMISINKMIPSSERSGGGGGAPMDRTVEPLLRESLDEISKILDNVLPERPKRTALEEAEYDDRNDSHGFEREMLQQEFDRARVYRPRLLIQGSRGMGQQYLGSAVLHKYERLHVQSFDLPTLFNDATRTPEAAVVQLFNEVRRHKPGIIYLPNVDTWYETVGPSVIKVFSGLLRSLAPNDAVLVLGMMETDKPDENMMRDLFSFSTGNAYTIKRPQKQQREEFFQHVIKMVQTPPTELPDGDVRPKRQLPQLETAPAPKAPTGPTKAELKAVKKRDMHTLNLLKIAIGPIMEHIKNKYKKFRHPTIDDSRFQYLIDERNPNLLTSDLPEDRQNMPRPFEVAKDAKGVDGLLEVDTDKFYYNVEIVTIEHRLSNGYYKRPKDFLADIRRLAKDARTSGNEERTLKANELVANVEVDVQLIETQNPSLLAACEEVYTREKERERQQAAPATERVVDQNQAAGPVTTTTTQTTGPIILGEPVPGGTNAPFVTPTRPAHAAPLTNGDSSGSHAQVNSHNTDEDVQMGNTQEKQTPIEDGPEERNEAKSQTSALTAMAHNSQPADYHNSASTTTSGQKTSDKSHPSYQQNTQSSNGVAREDRPDLSGLANKDYSGRSELPDTQDMQHSSSQSQPDNGQRQRSGPQAPGSLADIMHPTNTTPKLVLDEGTLRQLHLKLVEGSAGCSVEQLEQINAKLMDAVWQHRSEWNRDGVLAEVQNAFNEVIHDIERMQSIQPNSQGSGRSQDVDPDDA